MALLNYGVFPYADATLKGAREAARADGNASVTLFGANFDPQTQLQQCRDAITSGKYQALIIFPVSNTGIVRCMSDAVKHKVPVVSIDGAIGPNFSSTKLQVPGVVSQVLAPITADAQAAATMAKMACGSKNPCNVVVALGDPHSDYPVTKAKLEKEALKKYKNIKVIGTVVAGYASIPKGVAAGRQILTAYPNVHVIIGDTDGTVKGIGIAVHQAKKDKQVKLIGDGASTCSASALKTGQNGWFGSVLYAPRYEGQQGAKLAIAAARGKKVPPLVTFSQLSPTGNLIFTKAQVGKFQPQYTC